MEEHILDNRYIQSNNEELLVNKICIITHMKYIEHSVFTKFLFQTTSQSWKKSAWIGLMVTTILERQ